MNTKTQVKKVEEVVKNVTPLKVVETEKPTAEVKKDADTVASKMNEQDEVMSFLNPSAETRLKKLEQFNVLGAKFKLLKAMEDDLTKFILSSDGSKEKIELSNNSGFKFNVSNTQTIEKVLILVKLELSGFIDKADKEIKEFII